jgi:tellurite resistance protein
MTHEEQKAILAIAIHAAFADGLKDDREREEVRGIATALGDQANAPDLARLYQDVLLKRLPLTVATAALADTGQRQFAYEIALCVCEADGRLADAERRFLDELKRLLALPATETDLIEGEVDVIIDQTGFIPPKPMAVASPAVAVPPQASAANLDQSILNHALLNGALELLPQSWASMAIIPLQIKMVFGIGQAHGVELDQGQIMALMRA